ncbi:MAG TPA: PQQ-binding-like beta-propeller repeat protein [Ktedonobacterales bacterium]
MRAPLPCGQLRISTRVARGALIGLLPLIPMLALAACGSAAPAACRPGGTISGGTWPLANADYANTRDAAGGLITSQNVNQLCVAWTLPISGVSVSGAMATAPIVVDGTVYLQDLKSNVYAIDLQSGTLKWKHLYNHANLGPNGVAVDQGKVFVASDMQDVAALDAATGAPIWSIQIPAPNTQGIDEQPTAYNGTLYLSTIPGTAPDEDHFYQGGMMGNIYALDERTGAIIWSFNTVKDGDLWGNPSVNSGGGAWYPPAIDTTTGTTYWGTGNPGPVPGTSQYPNGSSRPGPNLYSDSELAISASGQLRWYQQVTPHDLFDHDFEASPILTTAMVNGRQRPVVIGAGKEGVVVAFDAQTGAVLWKTAVGLHLDDDAQSVPAGQTITILPGASGGVQTPMALADGVVYVPIVNAAAQFSATRFVSDDTGSGIGELDALDVNTGQILWTSHFNAPDGSATIAGDLVFTSTYSGQMVALDRATGHQVWSWQAPGGVISPLSIVGDTILVPVGLADKPELVALKLSTAGAA